MTTEIELKLDLEDPGDAERLLRALALGAPRSIRMRATYFDTPDMELAGLGYSVRIRQEGHRRIQTIKYSGGPGTSPYARNEWEASAQGPAPRIDPDHPLAEILGGKAADLTPSFEILTSRSTWLIESDDAAIEIALDKCEARVGELSLPFTEIELELKNGDEAVLFALARRIGRLTPTRLGVLAKAERAHRLMKLPGHSDKARTVRLRPDMTAADAFRTVIHSCVRQYRLNETRLLTEDNGHALHQARVALRRLRSALATFRPMVNGKTARRLNDDLRWLTGQLGRARNIDVLIPLIRHPATRTRLKAARTPVYADVRRVIQSHFARELMLDLAEWSSVGNWARRASRKKSREEPVRDYAERVIAHLHERLMVEAGAISGPDEERRHQARKTAKKLRYTVEFFSLLFDNGKERKARIRYLAALEELQDHLGALNDLAVMPQVLKELGVKPEQVAREAGEPDMRDFHILQAARAMTLVGEARRFWE